MPSDKLNVLAIKDPSIRTLHFTWVAFLLTFMVWFNHAPLGAAIKQTFDLSTDQWKALLLLNVALTIPARIIVGMLVDKFGPRATYSILLITSGVLCTFFGLALLAWKLSPVGVGLLSHTAEVMDDGTVQLIDVA